jgi:hypothetical protein
MHIAVSAGNVDQNQVRHLKFERVFELTYMLTSSALVDLPNQKTPVLKMLARS